MKSPFFFLPLLSLVASGAGCTLASETLLSVAMKAERGRAGMVQKQIAVAGDTIVYLEGGKGETVLLLHGFGGDKDNWTRFARHLTPHYRVIAPDLPGFGESTRNADAVYDIAAQAERLHAFATALKLDSFHLAGNSMGGNLTVAYASTFSDPVRSLGLLAPSGVESPEPSEIAQALAEGNNPLLVNSVEDYDRMLALTFVEVPWIPGPVKRYFAERAVTHRGFNDKIFADTRARPFRVEAHLPNLRMPALILWGDSDRILHPSGAKVYAAGLPNSQTVMMEACGHVPMIERPEETADHYLAFLRGVQ